MAEKTKKKSFYIAVWKRLKKNKLAMIGLSILIIMLTIAVFADIIADYDTLAIKQNINIRLEGVSKEHWFGTDSYGRDIFARIVHGSRISLIIGIFAVSIPLVIGGLIGAIAGYFGGLLDNILMRLMDMLLAIPAILLAIAIVAALGPGMINLLIALSIAGIPGYARIVKSSVITIKDLEFVEAAEAIGAGTTRILIRHILPNILGPVIVQATLGIASTIINAAALSFIGLGIQPPKPEWGSMLSEGREYIRQAPHLITFTGIAIVLTVLSLNLIGDGLRDALDPRLKD